MNDRSEEMSTALSPFRAAVAGGSPAVTALVAGACIAAFVVTFSAVHLLRPDIDPSWQPISVYALGPYGWMMSLCFAAWGAGAAAIAVATRRHAEGRAAKAGLLLLLLGAAGPLLAAAFPMDPLGTRPEAMSTSGVVHALSAVLGDLIPIAALMLSISLGRQGRLWSESRKPVRATAMLALLLLVTASGAMGAMMPASGELGPEVAVGWVMRGFVVASNAWVGVAAWATLRSARRESLTESYSGIPNP